MADWQDKVLNAQTPKATEKAFKGKRVKDVLKAPDNHIRVKGASNSAGRNKSFSQVAAYHQRKANSSPVAKWMNEHEGKS